MFRNFISYALLQMFHTQNCIKRWFDYSAFKMIKCTTHSFASRYLQSCALNIFLEKEFNWLHKKSKTENDGKDSIEPFNL